MGSYKLKECPQCGERIPMKWWWPSCPACRQTVRDDVDPADTVQTFEELLKKTTEPTRKCQPGSASPDESILAAIRAEKQRLGEGAEHTRYLEKRPSTRWRARGVTMRRR